MSHDLKAYLRAKAILLALVLDPPVRPTTDGYVRTDGWKIEAAHMEYENAWAELPALNRYERLSARNVLELR